MPFIALVTSWISFITCAFHLVPLEETSFDDEAAISGMDVVWAWLFGVDGEL